MTLANGLTLGRAALAIPIAGLVALTPHADRTYLVALALFCLGALSDAADGIIARRQRRATILGSILDPLADTALVFSVLVPLGLRLPPVAIPLAILAVREAFVLRLRADLGARGIALAPSPLARLKTVMLFTSCAAYLLAMATFGSVFYALGQGALTAGTLAAIASALRYRLRFGRALA